MKGFRTQPRPAQRITTPGRVLFSTLALIIFSIATGGRLCGDAGVLIPISEKDEPDAGLLSLAQMAVEIRIDNQYAHTRILQVFDSHVEKTIEGKYVFDLPADALISDFAVWDGVTRIPGVILERRKARNLYQILRQQAIDPGLLQQGEGEEPGDSTRFSARIVPIPGMGTKRLELEYTQWLPVENFRCRYVLPLKPNLYKSQSADGFSLNISVQSDIPLSNLRFTGQQFTPRILRQDGRSVSATLELSNIEFREDFSLEYELPSTTSNMALLTHPPEPPAPYFASINRPAPASRPTDSYGFFLATALLSGTAATARLGPDGERSVVVLMDTSLSMQWEKLEKTFQAVSYILTHLSEKDQFDLLLFNRETKAFRPSLQRVTPASVGQALDFVRASYIEDGSDLSGALLKGVEMLRSTHFGQRYLVLVTDGNATLGRLSSKDILDQYARQTVTDTHANQIHLCSFGVGSDANRTLLSELASRNGGFSGWVRESEDTDFAMAAFVSKLGALPVESLRMEMAQPESYDMVYPVDSGIPFLGTVRAWIGRYAPSLASLEASVSGTYGGRPLAWKATQKPAPESLHIFLPRAWAKSRVDALLRLIELEGENEEYVDEIIRLSKRYHFITPYTSLLAAPRALLRPRLIQPGDPVLRVRTDEDIESVTALFPFGLVKPMTYLPAEQVWQTRFLAPLSMADGRYDCRLILRDKERRAYHERKSFIIDSRPPRIEAALPMQARAGEWLSISARADSDTRTLHARLAGLPGVQLRWSPEFKSSRGGLLIPADMAPGSYTIQITAEDFAHNVSILTRKIRIVR